MRGQITRSPNRCILGKQVSSGVDPLAVGVSDSLSASESIEVALPIDRPPGSVDASRVEPGGAAACAPRSDCCRRYPE